MSASRPARVADLFWAFNRLALQGFGGVLPVAQRELVDRLQWLTHQQFLELLSLSQVLPGPNIVNLGLILGDRFLGWRGGVAVWRQWPACCWPPRSSCWPWIDGRGVGVAARFAVSDDGCLATLVLGPVARGAAG